LGQTYRTEGAAATGILMQKLPLYRAARNGVLKPLGTLACANARNPVSHANWQRNNQVAIDDFNFHRPQRGTLASHSTLSRRRP
jgi:hypothetical protein